MRTATPPSPADAAIRRAGAFLRSIQPGPDPAGERWSPPPGSGRITAEGGEPLDERQMVLPHVPMDAAPEAAAPAETPAPSSGMSPVTEVEKTIWGSPAGKKRLAARLVKLIPPRTTHVEPFAGSATVFFEKPPSDTEVLGDADPEIAAAFKALTTLTDRELAELRKKDWTGRATLFRAMQEAKPRSKVEKLYRFLYLSHFAYGKLHGKSYNPNAEGIEARTIDRIDKYIPLLKTGEERYVLGVVLEPETVDAQNDIYSAAEVREAAHRFMQEYQNVGLMHRDLVIGKVKILESYLAPAAFEIGGAQIRKRTWLLAGRILDDELWAQVKSGELTGLSIGGSARRHAEPDVAPVR